MSPLGEDAFADLQGEVELHHFGNRTESTALLAWFIESVMREDPEDVEEAICDGGGDRGIDGMVYDPDANELFVLQSKHRKKRETTQGEADLKHFLGVGAYFETSEGVENLLQSKPNAELVALIERLDLIKVFEEAEPTVRLLFVTNAERDASAVDYLKTIAGRQPRMELWDGPRLAEVQQRTKRPELLPGGYDLTTDDVIVADLSSDAKMALALVPATELVRLPGIENLTIFDLNVRLGLGNTKINRELRATIEAQDEHKAFPAYHNGLNLLTEDLRRTADGLALDGIAVVNGCQSLMSLYKERAKISPDLRVVVKVIELDRSQDLADRITYRSNNQNPVNMRDQRANDRIQRDLQEQVATRYGDRMFYDIRRGQPADPPVPRFDNQLAAQVLLAAWLDEPWAAVRKVKLFDHEYHRIFKRASGDSLYLAFLINGAVEGVRDDLRPELQTSFASVRHTIAYLVAKLVQQSELGVSLFAEPERWLPEKATEVLDSLDYFAKFAADETNYYVEDREEASRQSPDGPTFDPKTIFKSTAGVRPLERQVVQAFTAVQRRPEIDVAFAVPPK